MQIMPQNKKLHVEIRHRKKDYMKVGFYRDEQSHWNFDPVKRAQKWMLLAALAGIILFSPLIIYAAEDPSGSAQITDSFNQLLNIVKALVSSIGAIVLLWGFFEWGTSMQSQDGVMQSSAFKRIGGGLIMVIAPQLISAFIK